MIRQHGMAKALATALALAFWYAAVALPEKDAERSSGHGIPWALFLLPD